MRDKSSTVEKSVSAKKNMRYIWKREKLAKEEIEPLLTLTHMAYIVLFITWPGVQLEPP